MLSFLLATAVIGAGHVSAATSGSLSVLSINVAGLPPILNDNGLGDKTENTKAMGLKMNEGKYTIINVQEDFNFHAALYQTNTHPHRTPTSGGVPFGDGLNTLSLLPYSGFSRTKWNRCSNASGADCLTPKGMTGMRVRLDEGVYVDVWNFHADAGTEPDDLFARRANIQELANTVSTWSTGNAVLVFGDSNTRYTRADDNIRILGTQNGLVDPWVQLIHKGVAPAAGSDTLGCASPVPVDATCEVVDKILYRGSNLFSLKADTWTYETKNFLTASGGMLTDHNTISSKLSWALSATRRQSDLFGGESGNWFHDIATLPSSPRAASVTLRGANRLDGLSLSLTSGTVFTHGGSGGNASSLTLSGSETFSAVTWCAGAYNSNTRIFYVQLKTSTGRTVEAGKSTGDCKTWTAPGGWGIVGSYGRAGDGVDLLGWVAAPY